MGEYAVNYADRNFYKLDANRNRVVELGDQFGFTRPEIDPSGRTANWLRRSGMIPIVGTIVCDQYSFRNAVMRDIDTNRDQQIGLFEKVMGFIKYGLW